jgi:hypothetical protein
LSWTNKSPITEFEADVAEGLLAIDQGKSVPFDAEAVKRIKQAGRTKLEVALNTKIN